MHQRENTADNLCSVKCEMDYQGKVFITIKNKSTSPLFVRICYKDNGGGALSPIHVPAKGKVKEHIAYWENGQFMNLHRRAEYQVGLIYSVELNGKEIKEGDIGAEIRK